MDSKAAEETRQKRLEEFLSTLYGDPVRPETARTGRTLIIVGLISLAVTEFGGRLNPVSIFPVTFQSGGSELPMILGVVVLLLTLSFAFRAITDLLHEKEKGLVIATFLADERVRAIADEAKAIDQAQADYHYEQEHGPPPDDYWDAVSKAREERDAALFSMEERLGERRLPQALRRLRLIADVVTPLVIAVLALAKSWSSIVMFGNALLLSDGSGGST